jgi:hypothetical protein
MVNEYRYYTYKITFKDLPGYFYYGRRKDNGKLYFGSPKTFKHFWDQFEPEIQILQWYKTSKEVQKAEDALIGHTWKQDWNGKRYSLNRNYKGHIDEALCKEAGKKGGQKIVKELKGIHNPEYRNSEKCKNVSRNNGRKLLETNKGMFDPEYRASDECKEALRRGGKLKGKENGKKKSKAVICVETGIIYSSVNEAMREKTGNISRSARSEGRLAAGEYHWRFI